MNHQEPVGDFYVHLVRNDDDTGCIVVDRDMTSSTKLLCTNNKNKPTVIHFYNGG